jgi:hypothetical protein
MLLECHIEREQFDVSRREEELSAFAILFLKYMGHG